MGNEKIAADDSVRSELAAVKRECNGMLSLDVYVAIYWTARSEAGGTFVEIGTAHGASAIALALGLRDSGYEGRVYTGDRLSGGSRAKYGGVEENRRIIDENLKRFDVQDIVELCVGEPHEIVSIVPNNEKITLLMLDADGRIDRDFELFHYRMENGAPVIIDDVLDLMRAREKADGNWVVDLKMKLSNELVSVLEDEGVVEEKKTIGHTYFGIVNTGKDIGALESRFSVVYQSLIISEGPVKLVPYWRERVRIFFTRYPGLKRTIKSLTFWR